MITNIINFFQRIYQDNPSVAAILGVSSAGIVTSIIYICRSRIQSFFYWIKKQFTTTFLITNDGGTSEVYGLILKWLKKYNKLYTRSLTAPQRLDVDELSRDKISDALQYGLGRHLIWFHRQPIWLHIYEEKLENSRERKLYLSMSIIGRSHNLIYDLLDEVYKWNKSEEIEANKDKTRVNIYGYSGIDSWEIIRKRGFDTIYLSSKIEAEIKHNIQKFLDNEKIYVQHGIPYHYGMILYGPPGTGKTSIIKAIASEFDFDISLIDPLKFDITRLREKKENDKIKLLVIEDIDLLLGTKRETVEDIDIDEDEEDIIGEIIKVDRVLYEEYELKKTMTAFDVGEYSLFFANGEDGQKRIFLLDNGYYLLDRVNATDKEIILQVKEYLGKNSSPYFNGVNDERQKLGIIEDKEDDYIKFSKNQLLIDCKQFAGKVYSESDDKEYDLVQIEDYIPHSPEALIDGIEKGIIQLAYTVFESEPIFYDLYYEYDDEEYIYFSKKRCIEKDGVLTSEYDDEDVGDKNEKPINDNLELTEEKLTEILQSKNKRYTTFETVSACLVGSPINGIRTGEIGIIDKKISVEAEEWRVYTYRNEDEKRFYFEYSLKLSAEANDILPEWRMKHARQEYEVGFNNHIDEYEHYDLRIPLNEIEEILARESRLYYTRLMVFLTGNDMKDINNIRNKKMYIVSKITYMVYCYSYEDEDYFYFDRDLKEHRQLLEDYGLPQINTPTNIEQEEQKDYDYSIPINILEGNSWEKPFATNEGDNLYIWQSGMDNPTNDIPSQGIKFIKHLIAENLYFYDTPKSVNFTKAYRYVSHDEDNIYIKEVANYQKPQITKGDPFEEELEIAKPTDSNKPAPVELKPKTKVIKSGKDAAGKKVLRDLMNAIDGLITKENFIIIATTNSIESLDPALIRPGRFDTAIKIDYIDMEVFNKAMMRYFGKTAEGTLKKKNLTISRLQVEFLMGKTYEEFIKKYVR